jgi:hypothetical protein
LAVLWRHRPIGTPDYTSILLPFFLGELRVSGRHLSQAEGPPGVRDDPGRWDHAVLDAALRLLPPEQPLALAALAA